MKRARNLTFAVLGLGVQPMDSAQMAKGDISPTSVQMVIEFIDQKIRQSPPPLKWPSRVLDRKNPWLDPDLKPMPLNKPQSKLLSFSEVRR